MRIAFYCVLFTLSLPILITSCSTAQKTASADNENSLSTVAQDSLLSPETEAPVQAEELTPARVAKKGPYNPERTKKQDLLHTKLEVSFDWEKQHLLGTAELTLTPYFYSQNTLKLDAKGFDIHKVELLNEKNIKPLKYDYDSLILTVNLDKTYKKGDKFRIRIKYTAKPNELPEGGSAAIRSDKGLYFINPDGADPDKPQQIWTQGETEGSSCWFPTIDAPNERTTQEIYITVDKKYKTLSNGELINSKTNRDGTRTDYWKMDKPHAPYLFMMAIGEYAIVKDKWKDIAVDYYVEPEYEKYAKNIFGNTPEMLGFFSEKLGVKYPWNKYHQVVVRDYVSGAMENTTAVIFGEFMQQTDRQQVDQDFEGVVAHELFHHWFGDLVTCESWANLPLNESFANYSEYLWKEHKYGVDEADIHALAELEGYLNESKTKQEPLIRYNYEHRMDMFDAHSYNKGGLTLHMLRKYVGDEAFFASLNRYLTEHQYSDTEIHDLRLAFEEVTGEDLNWFFDQWFLSAGHPDLLVTHNYSNGKLTVNVTQRQNPEYTPVYKLPLYIDIWVNGKKQREKITVEKTEEEFTFELAQQPDLVLFDGDQQLLGIIEHEKDKKEYLFQFRNADKFLPRLNAFKNLLGLIDKKGPSEDDWKYIFEGLDDSAWKIREIASQIVAYGATKITDEQRIRIQKMAANDPKSTVRAMAVITLGNLDPAGSATYILNALSDKSYTVANITFSVLGQFDIPGEAEAVNKLKDTEDRNEISGIAYYFSNEADPDNFTWFKEKLKAEDSESLYAVMDLFGVYLEKSNDPEIIKEGVNILADKAKNHPDKWVRVNAYYTIEKMTKPANRQEIVDEIKAGEKDETLLNLYNSKYE